jgi:trans-aconitate methyltransferase
VGKRGETFDLGCGMGRQTKFLVWVTAGRWVKF